MTLEIGIIYDDLAYRPSLTQKGDVQSVINANSVKQSLLTIINTPRGSRLFEPDFGSDVHSLLFEHFHPDVASSIKQELEQSIRNHEPRIQDLLVDVQMNQNTEQYIINITYSLREVRIRDQINVRLQRL